FYSDSFINEIFGLAQECPLPKSCINYEVTETAVAALRENCEYLFQQLRQIGAKVLLDDFGSGYSSLAMIGDYSFDVVKIDKSLIEQIETKPAVRAVIESTISMCHNIGLYTVAEGVENHVQLEFLKKCGCDCIQGFYYAHPMSEQDFREYLSQSEFVSFHNSVLDKKKRPRGIDVDNIMDLVDHSGQFVQVCRPEDYSMVYANEMTRDISGHPDLPYEGERCYHYMLGLDAPCGHCPMKQMDGEDEKVIEVDDGSHVFSLKARYTTWNGKRVFIEYGRDVTDSKAAQNRYTDQIRGILENIPEGQGVFHVDLTADKWISSGGSAQNARDMQDMPDVNTLIRQIGSFVPDEEGQERFFRTFSRDAQLRAYAVNKRQIVLETESYYDDRSIRWSRITAHIIENPNTDHVESIIYGVDISKEQTHIEDLERERRQDRAEKEQLRQKIDETWKMYTQADRDRRYDYLTGLHNRLALYQFISRKEKVTGALMLDIDNFKRVNDSYGHAAGDECLKTLGRMLMEFSVERNIFFFRFGGEEVVGLMQKEDADIGALSAELLELVREKKILLSDGTEISVTVSIGYTSKQDDCQEMISQADRAMYAAKKYGKDQTACLD
ncbi:MAG: GGDEF domain-containing protein, partial [Eubacterium sp.]